MKVFFHLKEKEEKKEKKTQTQSHATFYPPKWVTTDKTKINRFTMDVCRFVCLRSRSLSTQGKKILN